MAETEGIPHNTITPIARMNGSLYECDMVLRNNRTTEERPLGLFHPNSSLHHIKKENIGLIEVMGLAVLPSRLAEEMNAVKEALLSGKDLNDDPLTVSHAEWAKEIAHNNPDISKENVSDIICKEIGKVFEQVLLDAGVFKRNSTGRQAFYRFRTCLHKKCVRIFEHNFVADKAKIRRRAVARQEFLTQSAAKFAEKTCAYACEDRFLYIHCLMEGKYEKN